MYKLPIILMLGLIIGCNDGHNELLNKAAFKYGDVVILKSAPEKRMVVRDVHGSPDYPTYTCRYKADIFSFNGGNGSTDQFETDYFYEYELEKYTEPVTKGEISEIP